MMSLAISAKDVPQRASCWNIPSAEGRALNIHLFIQRNLGPLQPGRALKNLLSYSARHGQGRGEGVRP